MSAEENQRHFILHVVLTILVHLHMCSSCRTALRSECEEVRFVPGHNLAGEGFDVVHMQRKGAYVIETNTFMTANQTCTVCENRFKEQLVQKVLLSVLDWRTLSSCRKGVSSKLHHSAQALIHSSTSSFISKGGLGLNLNTTAQGALWGSKSEIAQFSRQQSRSDKVTFITDEISCSYYSYRLKDHPPLSPEFSKHLLILPRRYNISTRPTYQQTIATYGTHYIRQVQLGGRILRVSAFRTCVAALRRLSSVEITSCLNVDFRLALGILSANASFLQKCTDILKNNPTISFYEGFMTHHIQVVGGEKYLPEFLLHQNPSSDYKSWMSSLPDSPDIVSFDISPLHLLVRDRDVSENLRRAIMDYTEKDKVEESMERRCPASVNLDHNCCPQRAGRGTLKIQVDRAEGLNADYFSQTDGFVKVWYGSNYEETHLIMNNNNPQWNTVVNFGSVDVGQQLVLEVWDSDVYYNDLIGVCRVYPEKGNVSRQRCKLGQGVLYFGYPVTCHAHLTG